MAIGPWVWVAIGVLSCLVATGLVVVIVQIRRRVQVRRMTDPTDGTLQVTAGSGPTPHAVYSRYELYGVVTADGLAPTAVEHRGVARARKWPFPGTRLPVLVDRADPNRLQIRWDRVQPLRQTAATQTEQLARMMRQQSTGGSGGVVPGSGFGTPAAHQPGGPGPLAADAVAAAVRESLTKLGVQADQVRVRTGAVPGLAGHATTAVVTEVRDVSPPPGQPMPPGGAVELSLEVSREDGSTYPARTSAMFANPERRARFGVVGARLPVRVDPADPTRVAIDPTALDPSGTT